MRHANSLLVALLGSLSHQAAAAVDCDGDIYISNATDATEVREACLTIGGDLIFYGLSESINLDGIESVGGSIRAAYTESGSLFNISSSTLTTINGSINLFFFLGLEKLLFPNLKVVEDRVSFTSFLNLTHLDLTNLAYTGDFSLDAPALERLDLNGLRGFTKSQGNIAILDAGSIDSLDGFFKNPIQPYSETSYPSVEVHLTPNIRNLTVGWTHVSEMRISGKNLGLNITLGHPSTKSMYIEEMDISGGIGLHRNSELQTLAVKDLSIQYDKYLGVSVEKLIIPFDNVSTVDISGSGVPTLGLPAEAEHWSNTSLTIYAPSVHIKEYDDDGSKIWYWPEDMYDLTLHGIIPNDFFDSFFERNATITSSLDVKDYYHIDGSDRFDCSAFKARLGSNIPKVFSCQPEEPIDPDGSIDNSASSTVGLSFQLQLAVAMATNLVFIIWAL